MNIIVFKVRTVPDIDSCRRIYDLHGLSDEDVCRAVFHKRRHQAASEKLQHHLQKIVSISAVLRTADQFRVWSLGDIHASEAELLKRFYSGIERYQPDLVSWCGNRHEFPIIRFRSLMYSCNAAQFWRAKNQSQHTDISESLCGQISEADIQLHEVAGLCGFPADGMSPEPDVWENFPEGSMQPVRNKGEIDVLITYLVYLRLLVNKDQLSAEGYQQECELVRKALKDATSEHLQAFEHAWIDPQEY